MRKFILCVMLCAMVLMPCVASASSLPSGLWIHARFENNYVPLINNKPDYSQFSYHRIYRDGTIAPHPDYPYQDYIDESYYTLPSMYLVGDASKFTNVHGTLIIGTKSDDVLGNYTGIQRYIHNSETLDFAGSKIVSYGWENSPSLLSLVGTKIYWNMNISGDASTGGLLVPSPEKITKDAYVIPYVKLETDSKDVITKINVYFIKSGDALAQSVNPAGVSAVRVKINGQYLRRWENPDGYVGYDSYGESYSVSESFSNVSAELTIPVYTSGNYDELDRYYEGLGEIIVEFDKGYDTYTYTFCPADREYRDVDWGVLSEQTIKIVSGAALDVFISRLPDTYPSVDISIINPYVASVDAIEFNVQSGDYSDDVYISNNSSLSFVLNGLKYGRTRLIVEFYDTEYDSENDNWYRTGYQRSWNIIVTDENGNVPEPKESDFKGYVETAYTGAYYVEGRQYYPSAKDNELYFHLRKKNQL